MSISLSRAKRSRLDLKAKTFYMGSFGSDIVVIGEYEIPMEDFLRVAEYVLTNTALKPNDPRLKFLEMVRSMKEGDHGVKEAKVLLVPELFPAMAG